MKTYNVDKTNQLVNLIKKTAEGERDSEKFLIEAEELLKADANPNATYCSHHNLKILHIANLELTQLLVKYKADVNILGKGNYTPIIYHITDTNKFIESKIYDLVKFLIDNGANVNALDQNNNSALSRACDYQGYEVVKMLLDKGADLKIPNKCGSTPLHEACGRGNPDLKTIKLLVENKADVNALDNFGQSPLNKACANGYLEIFNYLVEKGARTDVVDEKGNTMLHSVSVKNIEITKSLILKGVDVNAVNKSGKSILYDFCKFGSCEDVKLLIGKGADLKCVSKQPFFISDVIDYQNNPTKMLQLLVANGLNLKKADELGLCLKFAVEKNNLEVLDFLLQQGVDPYAAIELDQSNKKFLSVIMF